MLDLNVFDGESVLVTGGAGFIGSHLVDRLLGLGAHVTAIDNFITGNKNNLSQVLANQNFTFITANATDKPDSYLGSEHFSFLFHLASPASPRGYMDNPVETYKVNSFGTHNLAEYALANGVRLLFASTSEVYGDPLEHPQKEEYWGNVNPIGVRACYDVSKRFGEMSLTTQARVHPEFDMRIVRIFNTYGPRMDPKDGRVVPNFVLQALANQPITVHGDGKQTRSFCFVSDLVEFILRTMVAPKARGIPINIGHADEHTMVDLANKIKLLAGSNSLLEFTDRPEDDPSQRRPDLSRAREILEYEPQISLDDGLRTTIDYFRSGK